MPLKLKVAFDVFTSETFGIGPTAYMVQNARNHLSKHDETICMTTYTLNSINAVKCNTQYCRYLFCSVDCRYSFLMVYCNACVYCDSILTAVMIALLGENTCIYFYLKYPNRSVYNVVYYISKN